MKQQTNSAGRTHTTILEMIHDTILLLDRRPHFTSARCAWRAGGLGAPHNPSRWTRCVVVGKREDSPSVLLCSSGGLIASEDVLQRRAPSSALLPKTASLLCARTNQAAPGLSVHVY